jgi:hypothetical protein
MHPACLICYDNVLTTHRLGSVHTERLPCACQYDAHVECFQVWFAVQGSCPMCCTLARVPSLPRSSAVVVPVTESAFDEPAMRASVLRDAAAAVDTPVERVENMYCETFVLLPSVVVVMCGLALVIVVVRG